MRIKLFVLMSALLPAVTGYSNDIDNSYYKTDVTIAMTGKNPDASLKPCPVYDNKKYAFTMRWDDCNPAHFKMQKLMHKYGFKGTFYLNARGKFDYKKICTKGTDAGAHSMTHPRLPVLNDNKIFQETVEIKPFIESRTGKPVNAYCFSYGSYHSYSNPKVGYRIAECLQRAGYNFNTYARFVKSYCCKKDPVATFRQIVPGDRNPSMTKFEKSLKSMLTNPKYKGKYPNIGTGVHVWLGSKMAWNNMEKILKKYAGRKDWWYCTQSDYGAYRKLYKLCKVLDKKEKGNVFDCQVELPYASDVGTDVPLTMCFNGKASAVKVDGKDVAVKYADGKSYFNISPPAYAGIPSVISYNRNADNAAKPASSGKTRLQPWLTVGSDGKLNLLVLQSGKGAGVSNLKVKYILPLMYKNIKADRFKQLTGDKQVITKQLERDDQVKFPSGTPFLLCQIDYLAKGKPERAYASTFGKMIVAPPVNCFRDKALISNMFPSVDALRDTFCEMSKSGTDKTGLKWFGPTDASRAVYAEDTAGLKSRLQGEYVKFDKKSPYIAASYIFDSDQRRNIIAKDWWQLGEINALFVNGKNIPKKRMRKIRINKGRNHIIIVKKLRRMSAYIAFIHN